MTHLEGGPDPLIATPPLAVHWCPEDASLAPFPSGLCSGCQGSPKAIDYNLDRSSIGALQEACGEMLDAAMCELQQMLDDHRARARDGG